MYLVSKTFGDAGIQRVSGEVVTGDGYKLLKKLIASRFLTVLDRKVKSVKCELCSRIFVDQSTLEAHYLLSHPDDVEITNDDSGRKGE